MRKTFIRYKDFESKCAFLLEWVHGKCINVWPMRFISADSRVNEADEIVLIFHQAHYPILCAWIGKTRNYKAVLQCRQREEKSRTSCTWFHP